MNKLYAPKASEVQCISRGKARTPYEFGAKVSIATTLHEGFDLGMRSCRAIRMPASIWLALLPRSSGSGGRC